ncbi:FAD-binding monooxygenase [Lachnellula hyalina]|uniref:FAD-binding monooxygenase n=1 Tax=Lachnellula hyalina TaxID=1316788 RepID=A0A8H8QSS1_9HELO|nr:FAD-binding monooxygenase [Lachnellula hyalina]TVY22123.1 FAD-binding monooxygenase [Lachnellula hyalina]
MAETSKARVETITRHLTRDSSSFLADSVPKFKLEDHPVDAIRPLRVAVIGAGISGITAGVLFPAKVPGINLTIFEKNSDVGGTWFENIYPGVRCDVPANVYQSTYSPNTQWTEEFAQGSEIRVYWQRLASKHNVYQYIKFERKVTHAQWDPVEAKWVIQVHDLKSQNSTTETFDILITAIGRFNAWKLPEYAGIEEYQGHLRHSSNWDPNFDVTGKRVAVIGNGASGIQIVPELQKVAQHLDHYARSKTWIAGSLGGRDRLASPMHFSPEQQKDFQDPEKYLAYRKGLENTYWTRFAGLLKNSKENLASREDFRELMAKRLSDKPELLDAIVPDFSPNCRRLTPGPGYLEALSEENVSFIQSPIKRFTKVGIETEDGVHRPVDAVICSTGANVDYAFPFPLVASDIDLAQAWKPDGEFGFPYSYLGFATPGFPNLFFIHGPNAAGHSGTFPHGAENQVTYIARLLRKISGQGIKTLVPSKAAADDFVEYCDAFFPTTVLTEGCSSWSNGGRPGARIHGHWPGSAAHLNFIRRSPRWEDFEYELLDSNKSRNRFSYWGNGRTTKESEPESDLTPYLRTPDQVDLRDWHESWWNL